MENDSESDVEAGRIYRFIGEYVVIFQWLEAKVEEVILLGRGHQHWKDTASWLAKNTNAQKVDCFIELVTAPEPFQPQAIEGFQSRLKVLGDRLHGERHRRNSVLHSKFLFDFLAIGQPVLRTNARRKDGQIVYENEDLSTDTCDQIMTDIAKLAFELNMVCVQLVHLYQGSE